MIKLIGSSGGTFENGVAMMSCVKQRALTVAAIALTFAVSCALAWSFPFVAFADDLTAALGGNAVSAQAGDDLQSAQAIPLNQATTGVLTSIFDQHWYKVELPTGGKFQITFGGDYNADGERWEVSLRSSSNVELLSRVHSSNS